MARYCACIATFFLSGVLTIPMPERPFLRACGTELWLGERPFRNVGANLPDLFERFLRGQDADAIRSLKTARDAGIRFVRCFGGMWGAEEFPIFLHDRRKWLNAFDRMLAAADRVGIAVVPSLLFNAHMLSDHVRRTTGTDEQIVDYLTPGSRSNRLAVEYVTAIVTRYRDDPRILFWEIGNEYNLEADLSKDWKVRPANQIPTSDQIRAFLMQIASLIKKIDPNHLVTSGNSDMRPYAWHIRQAMLKHRGTPDPFDYPMDWTKDTFEQYTEMLAFFHPPPLDIISVHQYPPGQDTAAWLAQNDNTAAMLPWTRRAADRIGKPLFVGEFAQHAWAEGKEVETPWCRDFLAKIEKGMAPIAAVWAWEFDMDNPTQSPYSLSPTRTPALVRAIRETNRRLALK